MMKLVSAMAACGAIAAMVGIASLGGAQAANICDSNYYYSVEQPDWSMRGVPCWKPWASNPYLAYRASHKQ